MEREEQLADGAGCAGAGRRFRVQPVRSIVVPEIRGGVPGTHQELGVTELLRNGGRIEQAAAPRPRAVLRELVITKYAGWGRSSESTTQRTPVGSAPLSKPDRHPSARPPRALYRKVPPQLGNIVPILRMRKARALLFTGAAAVAVIAAWGASGTLRAVHRGGRTGRSPGSRW